jgi:hypothetical protein
MRDDIRDRAVWLKVAAGELKRFPAAIFSFSRGFIEPSV